jgi:hypothetical protein
MAPNPYQVQADLRASTDQSRQDYAAKQAEESQPKPQGEPSFLERMTAPLQRMTTSALDAAVGTAESAYDTPAVRAARDVVTGAMDAVGNAADTGYKFLEQSGKGLAMAEDPEHAADVTKDLPTTDAWNHFHGAYNDFRDAVAVRDPTLSDNLLQGLAQFAVPWGFYSRALSGFTAIADSAPLVARGAAAAANFYASGALTNATVGGKDMPRVADMLAGGRHLEGKLGDILRENGAVNAYINYFAHNGPETEAQARFKNVIDGAVGDTIAAPFIFAAGTILKAGQWGMTKLLEGGARTHMDLIPPAPPAAPVAETPKLPEPAVTPDAQAARQKEYAQLTVQMKKLQREYGGEISPEYVKAADPIHQRLMELSEQGITERRTEPRPSEAAAPAEPARERGTVQQLGSEGEVLGAPAPTAGPELPAAGAPPKVRDPETGEGMPLSQVPAVQNFTESLRQQTGNTSGHSTVALVRELRDSIPGGHPQQDFLRELLQRHLENPALQGSRTKTVAGDHPNNPNWAATYDRSDHNIRMFDSAFRARPGDTAYTFAHEVTHAVRERMMRNDPTLLDVVDQLRIRMEESHPVGISGLKGSSANPKTGGNRYGFTDASEFAAEVESNKVFHDFAVHTLVPIPKGVDMGGKTHASVWEIYKHIWGPAFGLSAAAIASPYFDDIMTRTGEDRG